MRGERPESDGKLLRRCHENALERHCKATIDAIGRLCLGAPSKYHDRYLASYNLVDGRNEELASLFDTMLQRSVAIDPILAFRSSGLMTDEEFAAFSPGVTRWINQSLEDRKEVGL
jgi:hypothetical protein